ncbi:MAG: hypothetical protein LBD89_07725 [Tannerellaceae bacterium]|jgi:hypothetical protein|nr:hypothetical protein [Tannerellaceae bacterium]
MDMNLSENYYDEVFSFNGHWEIPSRCGLRIIRRSGRSYVMVTELYLDNPGTSVTAAGESLLMQICRAKGLDPHEVIYIECNPDMNSKLSFYDEAYFRVTFSRDHPPSYRQLSLEEVAELLGPTPLSPPAL